jgi:hypothetical protein
MERDRVRGRVSAVLAALVTGAAVAAASLGMAHVREPSAAAASAKPATRSPSPVSLPVDGLEAWQEGPVPQRLRLKPAVVHPRKVVSVVHRTRKAATTATTKKAKKTKKTSKEATQWHADQEKGSGAADKGSDTPPPPPSGPGTGAGTGTGSDPGPADPPPPPPGGNGGGGTTGGGTTGGGTTGGGTAAVAPANTGRPSVRGGNTAGSVLTARQGTWTGTDPMTITVTWLRCRSGACSAAGTGATFATTDADIGASFKISVAAENAAGSKTVVSDASDRIERAG